MRPGRWRKDEGDRMAARFRQGPETSSSHAAPRHAAPAHVARAGQPHAFEPQASAPVVPEFSVEAPSEVGAISSHAPRPIGVDPVATGNFQRISAADGAVMGRTSAHDGFEARSTQAASMGAPRMDDAHRPSVQSHQRQVRVSRASALVIGIVAAIVLALVVMLAINVIGDIGSSPAVQDADRIEQTQVAPDGIIQYDGYHYVVTQSAEGPWTLVRSSSTNSDPLVLFDFPGTPTGLILYNGAFIIPENLEGAWDVVAWTMGDGSVPALLANEDGSTVSGTGTIASATLDGSTLTITLDDGSTQDVALS